MPKRPLTDAEKAAYRELAKAAAKLRKAQEAAEQEHAANPSIKPKATEARRLAKQAKKRGLDLRTAAESRQGVADGDA